MAERPSLPAPSLPRPLPLSALAARKAAPPERPRRILFAESFDPPPAAQPAPEPEIIAPTFTLEDLELARADAFAEGRKAGATEAEAGLLARQAAALERCATAIADSTAEARRAAETTIAALARTLIDSLATQLHDRAADLLPARIERLLADLRANLGSEVVLELVAAPQTASLLETSLATAQEGSAASNPLRLHPDPSLPATEVRVRWASAEAAIDSAAVANAMRRLLGELLTASPHSTTTNGDQA